MTLNQNILVSQPDKGAVAGTFIYREYLQLGGGHKWIRGVVVDNANSPATVYIWQGRSPNIGVATIILPKWSRGFSLEGTSGIYVLIIATTTATTSGQVFIEISDKNITAFANDAAVQGGITVPPLTYPPSTPSI